MVEYAVFGYCTENFHLGIGVRAIVIGNLINLSFVVEQSGQSFYSGDDGAASIANRLFLCSDCVVLMVSLSLNIKKWSTSV